MKIQNTLKKKEKKNKSKEEERFITEEEGRLRKKEIQRRKRLGSKNKLTKLANNISNNRGRGKIEERFVEQNLKNKTENIAKFKK